MYAVRAGPTLQKNILAAFEGKDLEKFSPQKDFLKVIIFYCTYCIKSLTSVLILFPLFSQLIGCGDGTALGIRWGLPFYGEWVWDLKNKIDVMFMDLFRPSLLPDPSLADEAPVQYDSLVALPEAPENEGVAVERLLEEGKGDFALCWSILRRMMRDGEYKERVYNLYREKVENKIQKVAV